MPVFVRKPLSAEFCSLSIYDELRVTLRMSVGAEVKTELASVPEAEPVRLCALCPHVALVAITL